MYLVFFTLIGECTLRYFYLFNIVLIINMVLEEAKKYNKYVKFLESQNDLNESVLYQLKDKAMIQFLNRVSKNLEYETIMQLIDFATKDENKDIRATVLNFLFRHYKKEFMNCFVC